MSVQELVELVRREFWSAWRFKKTGIVVSWTLCLLGWAIVISLPNVYEARARVYVDTSSVLAPILNNRIVPQQLGNELGYVRQALLGREHLERVVAENNLDISIKGETAREELFNTLRTDIHIDARANQNTLYNIAYRNSDRDKAVGVVRTLLTSFVENTLGAGREDSETAEEFVDARIAEYEDRLQAAEDARAEFKKRNADRLPGSEGGYFERMSIESAALDESAKALRLAEARRDRLLAQLAGESPVRLSADEQTEEPPPNSLDARIRDYRARLDSLLLQYTEKHPDVINTREALASLERQRREQLEAMGVAGGDLEVSALESNPIYQATRIALNEIEVDIEALKLDVEERSRRVRDLRDLIDDVPQVEAELARLNRDYDVIYEQYQSLARSRETQELSRKAADTEEVEFRVIDPPSADIQPVAPKRVLMLALVYLASLGIAGGICWLYSQLRPVFVSASELRSVSGLPVLGTVSTVLWPEDRAKAVRASLATGLLLGALGLLFLIGVGVETLGPGLRSLVGAT